MSDPDEDLPVHWYAILLCEPCIEGAGGECHSPGCALWMHRAPDIPIIVDEHGTCRLLDPATLGDGGAA